MRRFLIGLLGAAALAALLTVLDVAVAADTPLTPEQTAARLTAPVIMTGAQLPLWSGPSAQGLAAPYPSGADETNPAGDKTRSAHNGTILPVPVTPTAANPDAIAAYSWTGSSWVEIAVQIDQRFPYFLANGRSDFGFYSGTDEELSYAWTSDAHSTGDESWKNVYGQCTSRKATDDAEVATMLGKGISRGPGESLAALRTSMADPVPTLDDDDEIVFMARDAGDLAPQGTPPPSGTSGAPNQLGQTVRIVDPLAPEANKWVYLFQRSGGSSFTHASSDVQMVRDANADEWVDRYSFAGNGTTVKDPEALGTSNTGYGANVEGTVCRTTQPNEGTRAAADGEPRPSTDRFPRDGMTVRTPTYETTATGRWMVRSHKVTKPGRVRDYGVDLIDRWKGRAFQQSPDSSVSLVGFEDEQVNWEANASLLGWRQGPVRAIREVWGADSGTNVTKTETYYRDADTYAYHVRVHPIPSDGLYTSWDYNPEAVTTYYNLVRGQNPPPGSPPVPVTGVKIDGFNDDTGSVDKLPVSNAPAYFDAPDPTFDAVSAVFRPEQVAGPHGGLVYEFEFTGPTSATNATAVPYYRDDACLDDGTGDAPVQRPWPGEASTDARVRKGYVDHWKRNGAPETLTYADLECATTQAQLDDPARPAWKKRPFQGAIGAHGIHFFATGDTDNAFGPKPLTEVVGQQWRFSVPMSTPRNVVKEYGNNVTAKLQAFAASYGQAPASSSPSASPSSTASATSSASAAPSATPTASGSTSPSPTATTSSSATATATMTPSATATATTSASDTASGSSAPAPTCPAAAGNLTVRVNTPTINATGLASVTVMGARPGERVELQGYSQNHEGTMSFDADPTPVDRKGVADTDGAVTFNDLRPASNTRVRAHESRCAYAGGASGPVISVRATQTLRVVRTGTRSYTFSGTSIPARPGGLIVSLYRVIGAACAPGAEPRDCPGERLLRQTRARGENAPGAGAYQVSMTFPPADNHLRDEFVVKTGRDAQNAPGRSNVRSLLIY